MTQTPDRGFFLCGAVQLAKKLIGLSLVHNSPEGTASGIIVETEAYAGRADAACHSYKKQGPSEGARTNVMFEPGGRSYVYLIYGMYHCFNVTANVSGEPEAVLIRAIEPREGIDLMERRRGKHCKNIKQLCSGPGKLCIAMGITREHYGIDLLGETLFLQEGEAVEESRITATPRINVDYAGEWALKPYRFAVQDSPFISTRRFLRKLPVRT